MYDAFITCIFHGAVTTRKALPRLSGLVWEVPFSAYEHDQSITDQGTIHSGSCVFIQLAAPIMGP